MQELLIGFGLVLIYFAVCATAAILLRLTVAVPDEVFRKLLHGILLGSLAVWMAAFPTWRTAALAAIIFAVVVYPPLLCAEKIKGYSQLLTERSNGELKSSLLLVFFTFAVVVAVCWGWLGDRLLALACVYAWGFGDAAAALIGRRFGKHKIGGNIVKGRKSWEGTLAMFAVSFICVLAVLLWRGGLIAAIDEYWGGDGPPPQWRRDMGIGRPITADWKGEIST